MRKGVTVWLWVVFCMLMSACSSSDWTEQACPISPASVCSEPAKPVQEPAEQVSCDLKNVVWQVFVQEMQKNIQNTRENTSDKAFVQILASEDALRAGECVDINVDSMERLMKLPGVGEKRARAILQARQKKSFRHKKDIRKVRGIGSKAYQKMASMICDI